MKINRKELNNTPFFIFYKNILSKNLKEYRKCMPAKTEICYAMKANSEKPVLETLNKAGASFEVSSKYELTLLKKIGVPGKKIIFGTSVRPEDHIKEFVKYGVNRFAFDSSDELLKISRQAPRANVYVRVLVNDKANSVFTMSEKFGTSLKEGVELLVKAKELGLVPYGISFNVGSQARNMHAWERGITDVSIMMENLLSKGIKIKVINIGGGFPFSYQKNDRVPSIREIAKYINRACKKLPYTVNLIAEPGRGLVANTFNLVTSVISKSKRRSRYWLFLDAGAYNALLETMVYQGSTKYRIIPLSDKNFSKTKTHFILTGPTCDSLDVFDSDAELPNNIEVGDKLIIHDTGAYSFSLATAFNGFPKPRIV